MPWIKSELSTPIPNSIKDALKPLTGLISTLSSALNVVKTVLDIAKVFITGVVDPFFSLANALITALENVVNDTFGSGFFVLFVSPFNVEVDDKAVATALEKYESDLANARTAYTRALSDARFDSEGFRNSVSARNFARAIALANYNTATLKALKAKNSLVKHDARTGFPLLSAGAAIEVMVQSLDDPGDVDANGTLKRPDFSSDAYVCMVGILITAASLEQFLELLNSMRAVLAIPDIDLAVRRTKRYFPSTSEKSTKPDWDSLRLNSFEHLAQMQLALLGLLEDLRGYLLNPADAILDLINMLEQKVARLQALLAQLLALINALDKVSGVYFLYLPPSPGGNALLKRYLRDPVLEDPCVQTSFTVGALLVAGGPNGAPTLKTVDLIGDLFEKTRKTLY